MNPVTLPVVSRPPFRLELQTLLWYMRDSIKPERDYLQIFRLSCDGGRQRIEHAQEQPEYKHIVVIQAQNLSMPRSTSSKIPITSPCCQQTNIKGGFENGRDNLH